MSEKLEFLTHYHELLKEHIRFRTVPVGIKFLENKEEIPDGTYIPSDDPLHPTLLTPCQIVHVARLNELAVGGYRPFFECPPGMRICGLSAVGLKSASEPGANPYLKNTPQVLERAKSRFRALPKGKYEAIVASPLNTLPFLPDLIMQHGNPAQIDKLVKAYAYSYGKAPSYRGGGGLAEFCYSGVAVPMLDGEMSLVNDWEGRLFGFTQENELMLSIPFKCMKGILEGIEVHKDKTPMCYPFGPHEMPGFDLKARADGSIDTNGPIGGVARIMGMTNYWIPMMQENKKLYGEKKLKVNPLGLKVSQKKQK